MLSELLLYTVFGCHCDDWSSTFSHFDVRLGNMRSTKYSNIENLSSL
jgi:hypothetical protein